MLGTYRRFGLSLIVAAAAVTSSCAIETAGPPATIAKKRQTLGVPQDGFPSWRESVLYALTNRARADPAAELAANCTGCTGLTYKVATPLAYHFDLSRAARFQAASLGLAGSGLQHMSVCKLVANLGQIYPATCDGSPSCACEGGKAECTCTKQSCSTDADCTTTGALCDKLKKRCYYCKCPGGLCTSTSGRISRFGGGYRGENAAAGNSDPVRTFKQWINSSGHRNNLMNGSHRALGTGYADQGKCWRQFSVQVFGYSATTPRIPGAVGYPQLGTTKTSFTFYANYYDTAGGPSSAAVNIDGACTKLTHERGTTSHGSYTATHQASATGCKRYYFVFRDAAGALQTYPSSGSYGFGVSDSSCKFYDASARPPLGQGCGSCTVASDCDDGNPCTTASCDVDKCKYTTVANCCASAASCDDKDACTKDGCDGNNKCTHTPIAGCCKSAADCDDKNACTTNSCSPTNACVFTPIKDCCTSAAQCDDKNACTADKCQTQKCAHDPIFGCCTKKEDCDDGTFCTDDSCGADNKCVYTGRVGCCTEDFDCKDNNPCTDDSCDLSQGLCINTAVSSCCNTAADCDDGDGCTDDSCDANSRCAHAPVSGCAKPGDDSGPPSADAGPTGDGAGSVSLSGNQLVGSCNVGGEGATTPAMVLLMLFLLARRRR